MQIRLNLKLFTIFAVLVFSILSVNAFAEQVPASVVAVEGDPFYFSEDSFGIKILKYFDRSLEPYLVSGVTTDQSSINEISESYEKSTEHLKQKTIVSDDDRAAVFTVQFSGGEISTPQTFTSFSKYTHLEFDRGNPLVPKNQQYLSYGLELESLPSKDKEPFYKLVAKYINDSYTAEKFDVTIDVLTGDNHTLQKWKYSDCELVSYFPFLDENLAKLKFVGEFVSEIREKSSFECDGFLVDFKLREPSKTPENLLKLANFVPDNTQRSTSFVVSFSGGDIITPQSSFVFSKFNPVELDERFPILLPGYTIATKPQFALESLPSDDKDDYYEFVSTYLNPGKTPEPFDVTVDLVTKDNTTLQSWMYYDCDATNYVVFYFENLLFYKFKQTYGSEIRDKTYFECKGLEFLTKSQNSKSLDVSIPSDDKRAQVFVVNVEGPEISPSQTSYSFTKFSQITNEDLRILLPNAPFDQTPKFYLESLPNKNNQWFYDLTSKYINPGKIPDPFEITIDVLTGDGNTLQTWNYNKCKIIDYKTVIADSLLTRMFTEQFQPEIRDRTIFECTGVSLDFQHGDFEPTKNRPLDFVPKDMDRVMAFTVEFSGGEFTSPLIIYTFDDLEFTEKEKGSTTPSNFEQLEYGLQLGSLPSKDKEEFYNLVLEHYNVGKEPEPFDVDIDLITGDGTILQTWEYSKCKISDYETFLFDNLLFYKGHGGQGPEIRDNTVFDCVGFGVDFEMRESQEEIQNFVPSYEDRPVMNIIHVSGGDLTQTKSNELIQKFNTLGNQQFLLESLPNKQQKAGYDFISKYLNPGKTPEPFDVKVDMITGDGTILYSIDYSTCSVTNYAIHLNENMGLNKFLPSMKSEIREKGILDCTKTDGMILPEKSQYSRFHVAPKIQSEIGIPANEVVCKEDFELMIRPPSGTPVCISPESMPKLEQRGWEKPLHDELVSSTIKPILTTNDERAISFVAHFQGTDIAPPKTVETFSKFSPITDDKSIILTPDNPLDSKSKQFYLESLPSKDKQWLYDLTSRYINPGKIPELFEVTIEVISDDGTILQTWDYGQCEISNYDVYLDDSLLNYKYHDRWQSEIRDRTFFNCGGLEFRT
jgi:hypothetical protein